MNTSPAGVLEKLERDADANFKKTVNMGKISSENSKESTNSRINRLKDKNGYFLKKRTGVMNEDADGNFQRRHQRNRSNDLKCHIENKLGRHDDANFLFKANENENNGIHQHIDPKLEINKINDKFELTSNGMIKIKKKKMQQEEQAYLKSRVRDSNKRNDL